LGVVSAPDASSRARRGDTLALAKSAHPIPVSESVMGAWARLVADCRSAGIQRTVKLMDALIAATAIDLGLPVVTQDDDYDQMARAHPELHVLKV
jgi:predicted nucleic acid-binding protein